MFFFNLVPSFVVQFLFGDFVYLRLIGYIIGINHL